MINKKIIFFDIKLARIDRSEIVKKISEFASTGKNKFITYMNAHCLNVSFSDHEYKQILQKADIVYTGGQGIIWASRFLGCPLPERVNILDFFDMLIEELKKKNTTIYLLGNERKVVEKTASNLKEKNLNIVGKRHGFFNETEEKDIIKEINALKPDILIVGMGVPKQEKWIHKHLNELDVHLLWGVGAAFDWLSGYRKRAPEWMIKNGLEWLHRLYQQPRKFWKRYLIGNFLFIFRVIKRKILRRTC